MTRALLAFVLTACVTPEPTADYACSVTYTCDYRTWSETWVDEGVDAEYLRELDRAGAEVCATYLDTFRCSRREACLHECRQIP